MVMTLKRIRKEKIRKKMRKGKTEGKPVRHGEDGEDRESNVEAM